MKRFGQLASCILSAAALTLTANGVETPARSYDTIVERNPFGLRPPPDPAAIKPANVKPEPPKPKYDVKLTGINTYGPRKKAYFYSQQPGEKTPNFSLAEGESGKGVEVLEVDSTKRSVRVVFNGEELVMDFKRNGFTNAPPPIAMPGKPNQLGRVPLPAAPAAATMPGVSNPNIPFTNPNMNPGLNNALNGGVNTTINNNVGIPYVPNTSVRPINSTPTRGGQNVDNNFVQNNPDLARRYGLTPSPNQAPANAVSPEEQFLRMKVNEEMARRQNVPFPPLPSPSGGPPRPQ